MAICGCIQQAWAGSRENLNIDQAQIGMDTCREMRAGCVCSVIKRSCESDKSRAYSDFSGRRGGGKDGLSEI